MKESTHQLTCWKPCNDLHLSYE